VKVVRRDAKLSEVVRAAHAVSGLASILHSRQHQADQHRDDGDHHQQLDQRESAASPGSVGLEHRNTSFRWPVIAAI
jgi:hypothetical protein